MAILNVGAFLRLLMSDDNVRNQNITKSSPATVTKINVVGQRPGAWTRIDTFRYSI